MNEYKYNGHVKQGHPITAHFKRKIWASVGLSYRELMQEADGKTSRKAQESTSLSKTE